MIESSNEPTEGVLVLQATYGDGDAFTRLYDVYVGKVYQYIYYRVRKTTDVEDLTQDVFIRAWRSIQRYKPGKAPFLAWLYTIAHNLVVDYYRSKRREPPVTFGETLTASGSAEDPDIESFIDLDVVNRLLERLPADQQQVIMLRLIEGFDYNDIAAAMGKSQGAVRVIQLRALRRLRQWLEEGGGNK